MRSEARLRLAGATCVQADIAVTCEPANAGRPIEEDWLQTLPIRAGALRSDIHATEIAFGELCATTRL